MEKSTEFGGYALLSASQYGNPNKITDGGTTTGNVSGIVMRVSTAYPERVAAGAGLTATTLARNVKGRYIVNDYLATMTSASSSTTGSLHAGDALNIINWHGASNNTWIEWDTSSCLLRSTSGSIFSIKGENQDGPGRGGNYGGYGYYKSAYCSRAIVVVGSGI